jgi:hypothetical protein
MPTRVKAIRKVLHKHHWYRPGDEFEAETRWAEWAARPHLRAPDGMVKIIGGAAETPPQPKAPPAGEKKSKATKAPQGGDE